jgi:hypothetical protein
MLPTPLQTSLSRQELANSLALAPPVIDALVASGALLCHVRDGRETIPMQQVESFFRDGLLRVYQADAAARVQRGMTTPAVERRVREVESTFDFDDGEAKPAPEPAAEAAAAESEGSGSREVAASAESPASSATAPADDAVLPIASSVGDSSAIRRGYELDDRPVEKLDLRVAPRYIPRRQVGGTFNQTKFSILQISTSGLRIRHDQTLLPGEEGRLTFALIKPPQSFLLKARVVWTSIAQRGDDPTFCISGLRIVDGVERLRRAVDLLREARELEPDRETTRRSSRDAAATPASPPALRGLSDEEVASILRAVRKFASDPVEASRWYARARFAMVDEQVRAAIPPRARDREEILGVWEYLERRIDVRKVAGVVSWMRSTRAAVV